MRPEDMRAYKKRWELVAAVERKALRRMTLAQKLADLATLMETAREYEWETHTPAEINDVRDRWNLLVERWRERQDHNITP